MHNLTNRQRSPKGFTLIETLVVVVLILILSGMAIPVMHGQRESAKQQEMIQTARRLESAKRMFAERIPNAQAQFTAASSSDARFYLLYDNGFYNTAQLRSWESLFDPPYSMAIYADLTTPVSLTKDGVAVPY